MQFLYYRPGHTRKVSFDDIKHWGLEYAFDKQPVSAECMNRTPDGSNGQVFIAFSRDGEVPQMNLDKQTWRKLPGDRMGAPVYVGYWNEAKPGPEELVRDTMLPGYPYELMDGHVWRVPLVRRYEGEVHCCSLPRLMDFDEDGNPIDGDVMQQYRHLWELTKPVVDDLLLQYGLAEESPQPLGKNDTVKIAVSLLQANYRVSLPELVMLQSLPNDGTVDGLCATACDWPALIRRKNAVDEAKKNDMTADGVSTSLGGEG